MFVVVLFVGEEEEGPGAGGGGGGYFLFLVAACLNFRGERLFPQLKAMGVSAISSGLVGSGDSVLGMLGISPGPIPPKGGHILEGRSVTS